MTMVTQADHRQSTKNNQQTTRKLWTLCILYKPLMSLAIHSIIVGLPHMRPFYVKSSFPPVNTPETNHHYF